MVGLPLLDCMLNEHGTALAQSGGALPKRYAIVFAGQALGGDDHEKNVQRVNGEIMMQEGHPSCRPRPAAATRSPRRSARCRDLQGDFTLVSGMRIPYNVDSVEPGDVPAGGAFRDFHGGGASPLLSGTRSLEAELHRAQHHLRPGDRRRCTAARPRSTRSCCARSRRST